MSIYGKVIAAVAAMGLATCVLADENANNMPSNNNSNMPAQQMQADSTPAATTPAATNEAAATPAATEAKVDLNKADAKELMQIKGINAAKAKAIITFRKQHGDFKSVDEIKEVKGFKNMNEKHLDKILNQLTIG